jgi:SAM-dependent methyltransferase
MAGRGSRPAWKVLTRRAAMHIGPGRRLWWRMRKSDEVGFWAAWLAGAAGAEKWMDDREVRLDPKTEIRDPLVRAELDRNPDEQISILDVGAGPVTWLGYRYRGKRLTVVPVDPLADEYNRLLRDARLDPPVQTIRVAGEALLQHFGPGRFDIAFAINSLDHSADPFTIISNMVGVVRPGGVVILNHGRNEGERTKYGGLHQWNFDVVGNALLLWNNAVEVNVTSALQGRTATTAWISEDRVLARLVVANGG